MLGRKTSSVGDDTICERRISVQSDSCHGSIPVRDDDRIDILFDLFFDFTVCNDKRTYERSILMFTIVNKITLKVAKNEH